MDALQQARVLLAEDDAPVRKAVEGLLQEAGFVVDAVGDGAEALSRFESALREGSAHDLVVADIHMPRLDGFGLIDRLKALDPEVLVLFVTAYSSCSRRAYASFAVGRSSSNPP